MTIRIECLDGCYKDITVKNKKLENFLNEHDIKVKIVLSDKEYIFENVQKGYKTLPKTK